MNDFPAPEECLEPTPFMDSDHPAIAELAAELAGSQISDRDKAVKLYYWVRDAIRYNPYGMALNVAGLCASTTLENRQGWCVPKALLLAALCRARGIPAGLGLADVRNHLSTERMRESMETDVFYYHGYTSIYLDGAWVKATPAFNLELCEKFGLKPLEFDGVEDSLYHEFDVAGNRHMEYLNDHGTYADLPLDEMLEAFALHYPSLSQAAQDEADSLSEADWDADVNREVGEA
jgi:transglutaminase-like putative cysteine protease